MRFRFPLGSAPPIAAVQFPGGADFYVGAVASGAVAAARTRFRVDALPGTSSAMLAGSDPYAGATGWLLTLDDSISGSLVGQLNYWVKVNGGLWSRVGRKFFAPGDVGKIFTAHISCDGAKAYAYLDGKKISAGIACASIQAATSPINIAGRTGGLFTSAVTVIDVAEGTTSLSPSDVATDAASAVPAFAGQTHRYTASSSPGATWNDEVGTAHLTRNGSPSLVTFSPHYAHHKGTLECYGDSITAGRQFGLGLGDGWRRTLEQSAAAAGKGFTLIGLNPMTASTKDFDYNATASPGQAMSDRLTTLAADLASNGPADAATLIAYGVNDIVALNRTTATLQADITTAIGLVAAARPGRPIFVCNPMRVATGGGTSLQRAELATFRAAFPAFIAAKQLTYPTVIGLNPDDGSWDPEDLAVLYDFTHPSPTTYDAMGFSMQPTISAAL